jgi:hypothetical protein
MSSKSPKSPKSPKSNFDKIVAYKLPIGHGKPEWVNEINGPEKHFLMREQHYNLGLIPVKVIEPKLRYPYALLHMYKDKEELIHAIPYLKHYDDSGKLHFKDELPNNVTVDFVDEAGNLIEQNIIHEKYRYSGGKRKSQKKTKKNKRKSMRQR